MIEIGTFENFLPALCAQKDDPQSVENGPEMNPDLPSPETQIGFDRSLCERRREGYAARKTPHVLQGYDKPSFL